MSLKDKALLVSVVSKMASFYKNDKNEKQEIADKHQIDSDYVHVSKSLLKSPILKEITSIKNELTTYISKNTLAWDRGRNIMATAKYMDMMKKSNEIITRFNARTEKFIETEYENLVKLHQYKLKTWHNFSDYKTKSELKKKYLLEINFYPIPTKSDFRIDLADDEVKKIQDDFESKTIGKIKNECWSRLFVTVEKLAESLKDSNKIFRDSLIKNIRVIISVLESLNFNDDSDLKNQVDEIRKIINKYDVDDIRKDPEIRKEVSTQADKIVNDMSAFM